MSTGTVKGTVKNKKGKDQIGAEVQVEGTNLIAVTDLKGAYSIDKVPSGEQKITASMVIGKDTKEADVPDGGTVTVDLVINPLA